MQRAAERRAGVIGSLVVCTVLYLLVAAIMTGVISYTQLGGSESARLWRTSWTASATGGRRQSSRLVPSLRYHFSFDRAALRAVAHHDEDGSRRADSCVRCRHQPDLSHTGAVDSRVRQRHRDHVGAPALSELAELTNIGTLAAFVLVCVGVIVLRRAEPLRPRKFSCPGYPYVPILGALMSLGLMFGLPGLTSAPIRHLDGARTGDLFPIRKKSQPHEQSRRCPRRRREVVASTTTIISSGTLLGACLQGLTF